MTGPDQPAPLPRAGLCLSCAHLRVVRSGRGSVFLMCERGLRREPGFVKYPPLPVVRCGGHERSPAPPGPAPDTPEND